MQLPSNLFVRLHIYSFTIKIFLAIIKKRQKYYYLYKILLAHIFTRRKKMQYVSSKQPPLSVNPHMKKEIPAENSTLCWRSNKQGSRRRSHFIRPLPSKIPRTIRATVLTSRLPFSPFHARVFFALLPRDQFVPSRSVRLFRDNSIIDSMLCQAITTLRS